jgi:uncharacterized membrane-anchored protein YhcB (DUF1043 family)
MGSIIYILIGIVIGIVIGILIMMAFRRLLQKANLDMWYKIHSDDVLNQVKKDIENELKQRHGGKD